MTHRQFLLTVVTSLREASTHPAPLHNSRNPNCDAIVRDVHYYDRVGANQNIVTNSNWSKYFRTRANIHVVADNRRSLVSNVTQTNDDSISNAAVVAKLCVSADDDAAKMIDYEAVAQLYLTGQFNSSNDLRDLKKRVIH